MIPPELLKSLGGMNIKDTDMKQVFKTKIFKYCKIVKKAEHIWKMLDNMADSNYEEYKQFVNKHVSHGSDKLKEENNQKLNEKKIVPKIGILLKCNATLKEFQIKEKEEKNELLNKFMMKSDKNDAAPLKFEKDIKIYLNLCKSDKYQ